MTLEKQNGHGFILDHYSSSISSKTGTLNTALNELYIFMCSFDPNQITTRPRWKT